MFFCAKKSKSLARTSGQDVHAQSAPPVTRSEMREMTLRLYSSFRIEKSMLGDLVRSRVPT